MADRIYLIRHGELPEICAGRYLGRTDPELGAAGRAGCLARRERFRGVTIDFLTASPLRRTRETARLLFGRDPELDPAWREIDFGDWENLTFAEIERRAEPERLRLWAEEPEHMQFPGGESFPAFAARIDAAFAALAARPGTVAAVTHGGPLMRILAELSGLPVRRQGELAVPRGAVVTLERTQERWQWTID